MKVQKKPFESLSAIYVNYKEAHSPNESNAQAIMEVALATMHRKVWGNKVKRVSWAEFCEKMEVAHIVVIRTTMWLADRSSLAGLLVKSRYIVSEERNEKRPSNYYGTVRFCFISENEHSAMGLSYRSHLLRCSFIGQSSTGK